MSVVLSDGTIVSEDDVAAMLKKQYEILMKISKSLPKNAVIQKDIADANHLGLAVADHWQERG